MPADGGGYTVADADALVLHEPGAKRERRKRRQPAPLPDNRPTIRVVAGELDRITTKAEAAIIAGDVALYQRGPDLVRPITRETPAAHGRTTIAAALGTLTPPALLDVLSGVATFLRYDARSEDWVVTNPPKLVAEILLAREGHWQVPSIAGVVTTPTLRPDGTLLSAPGFDAVTRLYHAADPALRLTPIAMKTAPTRADAEAAIELLETLLDEFPFVSDKEGDALDGTSKAVALSALLTVVVRGAMPVAPLHAFRASTAGTGKSYLADVASAIATGRPCPVISVAPDDERETEKRITGLLLAGFPIVSIDDVNGELGGDLLSQATERPLIRLRPLGTSKIVEIEARATLFATGNNLRVRGDMVRRVIACDLDAGLERPELREFNGDPVATVLADRGAYVSAALTVVRAYIAAGKPNPCPRLASYPEWSNLVRSALVWLGRGDPVVSMETARQDDPELGELGEVLAVWTGAFRGDAVTVKAAVEATTAREPSKMGEPTGLLHPDLGDVLTRVAGERGAVSGKRLGYWLRGREGRIVGGLRFKRAGVGHGGVAQWQAIRA